MGKDSYRLEEKPLKIYTKIVIDLSSGEVISSDSFDYTGPLVECKGGGSSQQVTQQQSEPWSGIQPYLLGTGPRTISSGSGGSGSPYQYEWDESPSGRRKRIRVPNEDYVAPDITTTTTPGTLGILPEAERLYRDSPNLVANFTPEQEQAMRLQSDRARQGSDVTRSAQNNAAATLRGDYLYGGPGFDAAFGAASRRILPQVDSAFNRGGRYGSGLAQTSQTQALGDIFAGMYGQERNNQMQAMGMSPILANQDYMDIDRLAQVGDQRQEQNQMLLDEPYQRLLRYQGFINPMMGVGGNQTTTTPMYRNRTAGALGGAMLGNMVMPGLGGIIGGGLLGGYF